MHLIFISIVAICFAANYGQAENDGLSGGIIAFQPLSSTDSSSSTTSFNPNRSDNNKNDDDDDDSKEKVDGSHSKAHHDDHGAKITIDVHHILEIFKHELNAVEERIIAAVHHRDHNEQQSSESSTSSTVSYRIAART